MDSLSNFPEYMAAGAPVLLGVVAVIGAGLWLLTRKRPDSST